MTKPTDKQMRLAAKGRLAALVIAGTMFAWIVLQWIGPQFGLAGRFAILTDLLALVGLGMGLILAFQVWRAGQDR